MPTAKKTAAKKTKKNSSHKAKRAVVDELRWAIIDECGDIVRTHRTRSLAKGNTFPEERIARVRITEVTK